MTSVADVALEGVTGGHAQCHRGTALAAELHGSVMFFEALLYGNIGARENRNEASLGDVLPVHFSASCDRIRTSDENVFCAWRCRESGVS